MPRKVLGLVAVALCLWACSKAPARPLVTRAQFLEIKEEETTYAQVVALVGSPGVLSDRITVSGGQSAWYSWVNPDGSSLKAVFHGKEKDALADLKVSTKVETNLK